MLYFIFSIFGDLVDGFIMICRNLYIFIIILTCALIRKVTQKCVRFETW